MTEGILPQAPEEILVKSWKVRDKSCSFTFGREAFFWPISWLILSRKLVKPLNKGSYIAQTPLPETSGVAPCLCHCLHCVGLLCLFPGFLFSSAANAKHVPCFVLYFISALWPIPLLGLSFSSYLSFCSVFLCYPVPRVKHILGYAFLPAWHLPP